MWSCLCFWSPASFSRKPHNKTHSSWQTCPSNHDTERPSYFKFKCLCCINSLANFELHYAKNWYLSYKEQEFTSISLRILFINIQVRSGPVVTSDTLGQVTIISGPKYWMFRWKTFFFLIRVLANHTWMPKATKQKANYNKNVRKNYLPSLKETRSMELHPGASFAPRQGGKRPSDAVQWPFPNSSGRWHWAVLTKCFSCYMLKCIVFCRCNCKQDELDRNSTAKKKSTCNWLNSVHRQRLGLPSGRQSFGCESIPCLLAASK